jgi:hypothetical protein
MHFKIRWATGVLSVTIKKQQAVLFSFFTFARRSTDMKFMINWQIRNQWVLPMPFMHNIFHGLRQIGTKNAIF